jgi:hypothetical protein
MKEHIQLFEAYFQDLRDIHQTGGGVKEESYYGSLAHTTPIASAYWKSSRSLSRTIVIL